MIVHALVKLAGWGFGVGRSSVQSIVADYLQIIGVGGMSESTGFMDLTYTRCVALSPPANRAFACNSAVISDFLKN